MKIIQKIKEQDIFPESTIATLEKYDRRDSVRAIIIDPKGKIALLNLKLFNTQKLPGGGIEVSENIEKALYREILEETGCIIKESRYIGTVVEYRNQTQLKQISHSFIVDKFEKTASISLSEQEKAQGAELLWISDINKAIKLLKNNKPDNYAGKFIKLRDIVILNTAKKELKK